MNANRAPRGRRSRRLLGYALIVSVWITLGCLLFFFAAVFAIYRDVRSPARSHLVAGTPLEGLANGVVMQEFWPLWHSSPERAQFDPELIYVPRPGAARFRNAEFDTIVTISPEGLRQQPPPDEKTGRDLIVVAGDSYAMGWGVGDAETFSALLQERFHHQTLNAGVPSYGTARELLRLRRLGLLARAQMLVIQFCPNDAPENHEFLQLGDGRVSARDPKAQWARAQNGGAMPEVTYGRVLDRTVAILRQRAQAQPLGRFLASLGGDEERVNNFEKEFPRLAQEFLAVLDRFPELKGKPILVTELRPFASSSIFLPELTRLLQDRPNIRLVPLTLARDDYFRFDGHLLPRGHERVAEQLDQAIRDSQARPAAPPR